MSSHEVYVTSFVKGYGQGHIACSLREQFFDEFFHIHIVTLPCFLCERDLNIVQSGKSVIV